MKLDQLTFSGPPIDDEAILARVPAALSKLLRQTNGFVQFNGGLHVRGACKQPTWHSLRNAWQGEQSFQKLYPDEVLADDIPFAEDSLGDQFLLRDGVVWRLFGETGEVESLDVTLNDFLREAQADPVEYLSLQPLQQFMDEGGTLAPGQLLSAYPPFCTDESEDGVSLKAITAAERRLFLANLASQLRDGEELDFEDED